MDYMLLSLALLLTSFRVGIAEKPGFCPPTPPGDISPDAKDECTVDEDCPGQEKCCQTLLGKICLEPEPGNGGGPNRDINVVCPDFSRPLKWCRMTPCPDGYYCYQGLCCKHTKPGECPVNFRGLPAGPPCDCDKDCESNLKCCSFGGRQRCVFPRDFTAGTVSLSKAFGEDQVNGRPYLPVEASPVIGPAIGPSAYSGTISSYDAWNGNAMLDFDEAMYEQNIFSGGDMFGQSYGSSALLVGADQGYGQMLTQDLTGGYDNGGYHIASANPVGGMAYSHSRNTYYDTYAAPHYERQRYDGTYGQFSYSHYGSDFGDGFSAPVMQMG